jgi:hypothetical protein
MLSRQQVFSVPLAGPARRPEVRMLERSERKGHTSFGVAGCPIVRPFPNVNYEEPSNYLGLMRSGGLKTLKNKLGEYVRLAAGGGDPHLRSTASSPNSFRHATLARPCRPTPFSPRRSATASSPRRSIPMRPYPSASRSLRSTISWLSMLLVGSNFLAIDATCDLPPSADSWPPNVVSPS